MLKLMKFEYKNNYHQDSESFLGTFFLAKNDTWGVYGGAVLFKKNIETLYSKLKNIFLTLRPEDEEIWTLSTCLSPIQEGIDRAESPDTYHSFYKNLLQHIKDQTEQHKVKLLCLTLSLQEYLRTRRYGFWPYLIEIRPDESEDGKFHGILSLKGVKYNSYINVLSTLNHYFERRLTV